MLQLQVLAALAFIFSSAAALVGLRLYLDGRRASSSRRKAQIRLMEILPPLSDRVRNGSDRKAS